jgi:hypothetical protein
MGEGGGEMDIEMTCSIVCQNDPYLCKNFKSYFV